MSAYNFETLLDHVGHNVEVVTYQDEQAVFNVAIECRDCSTVLLDYDNPALSDEE